MTTDLDPRQLLIIKLIAQGLSRKEIAEKIGLSVKTIEFHINGTENKNSILNVLGVTNVADITRFAIQHKLVNPEKDQPTVNQVVDIQTTGQLAQALLRGASLASAGKADVLQVNALVQCSDAIIRLARLQMDAINTNAEVPWLSPPK